MNLSFKEFELSGVTKVSLAVAGVLAVAWLLLTLFAGGGGRKTGAARTDASLCPDCGKPLTRDAKRTGDCPYCKMEDPEGFRKRKLARESAGRSRAVPAAIVSLVSVLLLVNLAVFLRGKWMKPAEDEVHALFCRKCGRKVRYRTSQVGKFARCPHCRDLMRFPEAPAAVKGRWSAVTKWLAPARKKPHADSA